MNPNIYLYTLKGNVFKTTISVAYIFLRTSGKNMTSSLVSSHYGPVHITGDCVN